MGMQAINTLMAKRSEMTPEQQVQADAAIVKFQGRITAAQQMVTPYVKESAAASAPTAEAAPVPTPDLNAGGKT
jgi:hypothetical protein